MHMDGWRLTACRQYTMAWMSLRVDKDLTYRSQTRGSAIATCIYMYKENDISYHDQLGLI